MLVAFHKPYGVLSQFTPDQPGQRTLAEFGFPKGIFPIGRLDQDSEGLILLGNEPRLVERFLDPRHGHPRTYHVQVEGDPDEAVMRKLAAGGIDLKGHRTLPCQARLLPDPGYPPRDPPVRFRKSVPDRWIELVLTEGKNRQVRRMTAAVGFPTLRLIRAKIGRLPLTSVEHGTWRELTPDDRQLLS
ncbi:pseudouridine synthase [Luteolibacter flavescens]|uniref:Pseudouridine synthase n=1 Tax=Luteolibacter flavescens TaxID=1859460 RepID=A0ABT3FIQ2_9BACT|nr:pseudouridine synthase [Luteolibacter flavescens]MCW1883327.1 pseudouridine synthase [Luteolibacter flavescens]